MKTVILFSLLICSSVLSAQSVPDSAASVADKMALHHKRARTYRALGWGGFGGGNALALVGGIMALDDLFGPDSAKKRIGRALVISGAVIAWAGIPFIVLSFIEDGKYYRLKATVRAIPLAQPGGPMAIQPTIGYHISLGGR